MRTQRQTSLADALEYPEFRPVIHVLRQVVYSLDRTATHVTLDAIKESLRYLDVIDGAAHEFLRDRLSCTLPERASDWAFAGLMSHDFAALPRLKFDGESRGLLNQLIDSYGLCLAARGLPEPRGAVGGLFGELARAARSVQGQQTGSNAAALQLALQVSATDRGTPARLLLHGPQGNGTAEMALALAGKLAAQGFAVLEINCAQFRSEGEGASWDGAKSYWHGSKPGIVTSFIYQQPRSVVVFHDIDQTHPDVQRVLHPALTTGTLVDNYGLEARDSEPEEHLGRPGKRPPTPVDCREAVFIFTASTGSEWYQHPELSKVLGEHNEPATRTIREAMEAGTYTHRGEETPRFDAGILRALERHLVLLRPQTFETLVDATQDGLLTAAKELEARFGWRIVIADPLAIARAHVLSLGHAASLESTRPYNVGHQLLTPLAAYLIEHETIAEAHVGLTPSSLAALNETLTALGPAPLDMLQRQRKSLVLSPEIKAHGKKVELHWKTGPLEKRKRLAEYTGAVVRLVAEVPDLVLDHVIGHHKTKQFFREVIDYLRQPKNIESLGIDVPAGAVLHGPPGTGKTLLAKAFAGEAGLPFIAVNGADLLDENTIRQLYDLAKRNAPVVIFIDEADALGRRGAISPRHDAAINQMLSEIQGFSSNAPIFHLLATNRPSMLDEALTRAGRIDRSFYIGTPDREARRPFISKLLALTGQNETQTDHLLGLTHGLTGAALEQIRRECGLRLLREGRPRGGLPLSAVVEEINNVKYGVEADRKFSSDYRARVALHEVGHAVAHTILFPDLAIEQVTITARENGVAGFMAIEGEQEQVDETPERVKAYLTVLLAGRAAEIIRFGSEGRSTGAASDLRRATQAARDAVAFAGLDDEFGPLSLAAFGKQEEIPATFTDVVLGRVRCWLDEAERSAATLLRENWPLVEELTDILVAHEYIDGSCVSALVSAARCASATPSASLVPNLEAQT